MSYTSPLAQARKTNDPALAYLLGDPCSYCVAAVEVLDHITPRVRGGTDHWLNLTLSCSRCNLQKRALSLLGFFGWMGYSRNREVAARLEGEAKRLRALGIAISEVGR